jgi:hypothetical protein
MPAPDAKLRLGNVLRGIARTCREQWRLLLVAGLVVFVPLGLIEALDVRIQEIDLDEVGDLAALAVVGVAFGHAGTALLGDVFYSGVVASGVSETRGGERHTLGAIARRIPYGRLVIVDLVFSLIVVVGTLLLIVPGIVFFAWFALAGPIVKIEKRSPIAALRRSRELVRGSFWRVLAIVLPIAIVTNALVDAGGTLGSLALGDSLVGDWAGSALGGMLATPLYAAALVVLTYELLALEKRS